MFDERHLRPVSGEIMTDGRGASSRVLSDADIEDAEFVTIAAPSRGTEGLAAGDGRLDLRPRREEPEADAAGRAGMDVLKRSAAAQPAAGARGGPLFWAAGLVVARAAFWSSGGHALFGPRPAGAGETLRIVELASRTDESTGRRLLVVDGAVENAGSDRQPVPPLAIEVTGDAGRVTRYTLDSAGALVEPGGRYRFSSRVDAPMGAVAGVSVKMARRD
jgi:hypothetical protein